MDPLRSRNGMAPAWLSIHPCLRYTPNDPRLLSVYERNEEATSDSQSEPQPIHRYHARNGGGEERCVKRLHQEGQKRQYVTAQIDAERTMSPPHVVDMLKTSTQMFSTAPCSPYCLRCLVLCHQMGLTTNIRKSETITDQRAVAGHRNLLLHDLGRRQGRSHPVTTEKNLRDRQSGSG